MYRHPLAVSLGGGEDRRQAVMLREPCAQLSYLFFLGAFPRRDWAFLKCRNIRGSLTSGKRRTTYLKGTRCEENTQQEFEKQRWSSPKMSVSVVGREEVRVQRGRRRP